MSASCYMIGRNYASFCERHQSSTHGAEIRGVSASTPLTNGGKFAGKRKTDSGQNQDRLRLSRSGEIRYKRISGTVAPIRPEYSSAGALTRASLQIATEICCRRSTHSRRMYTFSALPRIPLRSRLSMQTGLTLTSDWGCSSVGSRKCPVLRDRPETLLIGPRAVFWNGVISPIYGDFPGVDGGAFRPICCRASSASRRRGSRCSKSLVSDSELTNPTSIGPHGAVTGDFIFARGVGRIGGICPRTQKSSRPPPPCARKGGNTGMLLSTDAFPIQASVMTRP